MTPYSYDSLSLFFWYSVSQPGHKTFRSFDEDLSPRNPEWVSFELKCPDLLEKTKMERYVIDVVVLEVNFNNLILMTTVQKVEPFYKPYYW